MYTRAAASDYDDWETVYGNRGWSCSDLLPLHRKVSEGPEYAFPCLGLTSLTLSVPVRNVRGRAGPAHAWILWTPQGLVRRVLHRDRQRVPERRRRVRQEPGPHRRSECFVRLQQVWGKCCDRSHACVTHALPLSDGPSTCPERGRLGVVLTAGVQVDRLQDGNPVGCSPPLHLQAQPVEHSNSQRLSCQARHLPVRKISSGIADAY